MKTSNATFVHITFKFFLDFIINFPNNPILYYVCNTRVRTHVRAYTNKLRHLITPTLTEEVVEAAEVAAHSAGEEATVVVEEVVEATIVYPPAGWTQPIVYFDSDKDDLGAMTAVVPTY